MPPAPRPSPWHGHDCARVAACLLTACARAWRQSADVPVHKYGSGDTFGELALLYNCPRAASVVTVVGGECWALDRAYFRNVLMASNMAAMDSAASFLKSVALFSPLTDEQREALSEVHVHVHVHVHGHEHVHVHGHGHEHASSARCMGMCMHRRSASGPIGACHSLDTTSAAISGDLGRRWPRR